jgi:hypothetical protein
VKCDRKDKGVHSNVAGHREPVAARKQGFPPANDTVSPSGPLDVASEEIRRDEAVVARVEHLPRDVAWTLVVAGVIGVIAPGVLGAPFLLLGTMALWPGNEERLARWRKGHSPKFFHGGMKQVNRFLDDLERRYPRNGQR